MEKLPEVLLGNRELSNRGIAAKFGVNDKTVGRIRQELKKIAIRIVTQIIGHDGK